MSVDAGYPTYLESNVVLRDGSVAHIRPVRHDDESRLLEFLQSMPPEDRRLRFFGLGSNLARTARDEADVDYAHSLGLIVTVEADERVVAHGMYATSGPGRAEVAFSILPAFQSRGLATLLLGQLAEAAAAAGIPTFEARMLRENRRMLDVFRQSGFPIETHYDFDTIEASFPT